MQTIKPEKIITMFLYLILKTGEVYESEDALLKQKEWPEADPIRRDIKVIMPSLKNLLG